MSDTMSYGDIVYELYRIESERINKEYDYSLVMESVSDSSRLKKFFVNIITAMRNFINKLSSNIEKGAREISYASQLRKMEGEIRKAMTDGKTKCILPDYPAIRKEYAAMAKDLKGYAKKFIKMRYKSTIDLDDDLAEFDELVTKWDTRMEKVLEKKMTLSVEEALKFVENERRGKTHVLDHLNDSITVISEMQHVAEEVSKRTDTLGSDVLEKHQGALRRIANAISTRMTRFASKVIFTNVLLFA